VYSGRWRGEDGWVWWGFDRIEEILKQVLNESLGFWSFWWKTPTNKLQMALTPIDSICISRSAKARKTLQPSITVITSGDSIALGSDLAEPQQH
jgi:hypothetical protein